MKTISLLCIALTLASCSKEDVAPIQVDTEQEASHVAVNSTNQLEVVEKIDLHFFLDSSMYQIGDSVVEGAQCQQVYIHLTDTMMSLSNGVQLDIKEMQFRDEGFIKWQNNSYYNFDIETTNRWSFHIGNEKITWFVSNIN